MDMWTALRTCPHIHRPGDYYYHGEDHLATYTLDGTHTFRRLLIRWEKKVENYIALLHFACAWITFRAAKVIG